MTSCQQNLIANVNIVKLFNHRCLDDQLDIALWQVISIISQTLLGKKIKNHQILKYQEDYNNIRRSVYILTIIMEQSGWQLLLKVQS